MIGLCSMENTEFEALIAPYVSKIVDENSKLTTYVYTQRTYKKSIVLRKDVELKKPATVAPRRIQTPEGVFANVHEAADHFGLTKESVYMKINKSKKLKDKKWVLLEHERVEN